MTGRVVPRDQWPEDFRRRVESQNQIVVSEPVSFAVKDGHIYVPGDPEYDRLKAEAEAANRGQAPSTGSEDRA